MRLSSEQRKKMPSKQFVFPSSKSYPINDEEHGRKAIQLGARSVKAGNLSPGGYAKVKTAVHNKFPGIGQ